MNERLFLLKIELSHIEPKIWRRFAVPASISLDRLHDVIQIVMGWGDSHLFEFDIDKKQYTEDPETEEDGFECGEYRLGDLLEKEGESFRYIYDFGDNWDHVLTIEDSNYVDSELYSEIVCLDGEKACPPDDVGGPPGFIEFSNAIRDPEHENHEETRKWVGDEYDVERFDSEIINIVLMQYQRWSRDRHQLWAEDE